MANTIELFQKELLAYTKAFTSLADKQTSPGQFRILVNQLLNCFQKYEKIELDIYAEKIIGVGESLLEVKGLHYLAETICFQKARSIIDSSSLDLSRLKKRLMVSSLIYQFLLIIEKDYGFQSPEAAVELANIVYRFKDMYDDSKFDIELVYHCLAMTRFALNQNQECSMPNLDWIFSFSEKGDLHGELQKEAMLRVTIDLIDLFYRKGDKVNMEHFLKKSIDWFNRQSQKAKFCSKKYQKRLNCKYGGILIEKHISQECKASILAGFSVPSSEETVVEEISWKSLLEKIGTQKWGLFEQYPTFLYRPHRFPDPIQLKLDRVEDTLGKISSCLLLSSEAMAQTVTLEDEVIVPELIEKEDQKTKKKIVLEDDTKCRKTILADLQAMLAPLTPIEKFSVLVQALKLVVTEPSKIKYAEKGPEQLDFMIQTLIEMGDALVNYGFVQKEKRQHFEKEIETPYNLEPQDLLDFSLALFQYRQWKRLCSLENHIQRLQYKGKGNDTVILHYSLLLTAAKFLFSNQNDRKVSFEPNLDGTATSTDENVTKFEFSDQLKVCVYRFCEAILQCLRNKGFSENHSQKTLDCCMLVWRFLEPFLRPLSSTNDRDRISGLENNDFLMLIVEFLHTIFCYTRIANHKDDLLLAFGISQKLALIYECLEEYHKSCQVLQESLTQMERVRKRNCWLQPEDYFTADLHFLGINSPSNSPPNMLKKSLGCLQLDLHGNLFRCRIREYEKQQEEKIKQKQEDELKLKHVHVDIPKQSVHKDEIRIRQWCGTNPIKKALFNLAVIQHGECISVAEKRKLLMQTSEYLEEAKGNEIQNLNLLSQSKELGLTVLQKSCQCAVVQVNPHTTEGCLSVQCNLVSPRIDIHSNDVSGTGIRLTNSVHPYLVVLSGMIPDEKYRIFCVDDERNKSKKSLPWEIVSSLPVSLPLAWTYLFKLSLQYDLKITQVARLVLEKYLIFSKCEDAVFLQHNQIPNPLDFPALYDLNWENLKWCDPSVIRGYSVSLLHALDKEEQLFIDSDEKANRIVGQIFLLRMLRDQLAAADFAKSTNNFSVELLCVLRVFEKLQPFLRDQRALPPVVLYIFARCHQTVLRCCVAFEDDRPKGLKDYLLPITFLLVQSLINLGNAQLALQVAYDTVSLINQYAHNTDNRIVNSTQFESSVLGYQYKPQKGKAKRGSTQYLMEFGFHGLIAVIKPANTGFPTSRKQFDYFYEQMELLLIKSKASLVLADPSQKKTLLVSRKTLDNYTTLRELYQLFTSTGPEATIQELFKFKKNPRFLEIITEIATWCFEREQMDAVVKIAVEVEDWVDRRTQAMIRMDELLEDSIAQKKDIVIKRRKRPLFALDKIESLVNPRGKSEQRGRESLIRSRSETRLGKPGTAKNYSRYFFDKPTASNSVANSRPVSRERTGTRPASRDRVGSPTDPLSAISTTGNASDSKEAQEKKKRALLRQNIFAGLSQLEKEKVDNSIRVLDQHLHYLWHRRCYASRLRAILEFENPARSKLLLLKANAFFTSIQKDPKYQSSHFQFDMEWFQLSKAGLSLWTKVQTAETSLQALETYQIQNYTLIEMVQSFVQSIVISSRCKDHIQVVQNCKAFWQAITFLLHHGRLEHPFWNLLLARGLLSVGLALIDTLETLKYSKMPHNNEFLYVSPDDAKNEMPIRSLWELYHSRVYAFWIDRNQTPQSLEIDLVFCSELLIFVIQTLFVSKRYHRAAAFTMKVLDLFNNVHDPILAPLLEGSQELLSSTKCKMAIEMRTRCRYWVSLSILELTKSGKGVKQNQEKEVTNLYFRAIERSKEEGKRFLECTLHNELADFLFESGNVAGATVHWSSAVDCLVGSSKSIMNLAGLIGLKPNLPNPLSKIIAIQDKMFGVYGNIFLAHIVMKMVRFVFPSNYDKQNELTWVAAELLALSLRAELGSPENYSSYKDHCAKPFLEKNAIFRDKFIINPTLFFNNLCFLVQFLLEEDCTSITFPIISIAEALSTGTLNSLSHSNSVLLMKAEALGKMGRFNESIQLYNHCSKRISIKKKVEEDPKYDNNAIPLSKRNFQILKDFSVAPLADKLRSLQSPRQNFRFEITKFKVILEAIRIQQHFLQTSVQDTEENAVDIDAALSDLFTNLRAQLWRVVSSLLVNIRKTPEQGTADADQHVQSHCMLLESFYVLCQICYHQRKYQCSVQWSIAIKNHLERLQSGDYADAMFSLLGMHFLYKIRIHLIKSLLATNNNALALEEIKSTRALFSNLKCQSLDAQLILLKVEANQAVQQEHEKAELLGQIQNSIEKLTSAPMKLRLLASLHDVLGVLLLGWKWNSLPTNNIPLAIHHAEMALKCLSTWRAMYGGEEYASLLSNELYLSRVLCCRFLQNGRQMDPNELCSILETCHNALFKHDPQVAGFHTSLAQFIFGSLCFQLRNERNDSLFSDMCQKVFHDHLLDLKKSPLELYHRLRVVYAMLFAIEIEKGNYSIAVNLFQKAALHKVTHESWGIEKNAISLQDVPHAILYGLETKELTFDQTIDLTQTDESSVMGKARTLTADDLSPAAIQEYYYSLDKELTQEKIAWYCERNYNIAYQHKRLCQFMSSILSPTSFNSHSETIFVGWLYRPKRMVGNNLAPQVLEYIVNFQDLLTHTLDSLSQGKTKINHEKSSRTLVVIHQGTNETKHQVVLRNIPKMALEIMKMLIRSVLVSLTNAEMTQESLFLSEANEHWTNLLNLLSRILSQENQDAKTPLPPLTKENVSVLQTIFDHFEYCGIGKDLPLAIKQSSKPSSAADQQTENVFQWMVRQTRASTDTSVDLQ